MTSKPTFDIESAHKFFSTSCFNRAWALIEKHDRAEAETDEMIALAHASSWHWEQRIDTTERNRSISYWQLARVYALARRAEVAMHYAVRCLNASEGQGAFLLGFAYEALARAAMAKGDIAAAQEYIAQTRALLPEVTDPEERGVLTDAVNDFASQVGLLAS